MLLKTVNKKRHPFNVESILPVVGKVTIDVDGTLEVADELAEEFMEVTDFFPVVVDDEDEDLEDLKEKSEGDDLNGGDESLEDDDDNESLIKAEGEVADEDEDEDDEDELTQEEKAAIVASLPELKRVELQNHCQPFPSKEWRALDKQGLVDYLTQKFK